MFRVFSCLATEHDVRLVGLAGLICFLASFAAISLFHRARASQGRARVSWIMTAGIAAGCGNVPAGAIPQNKNGLAERQ